jgi:hypothetical protein
VLFESLGIYGINEIRQFYLQGLVAVSLGVRAAKPKAATSSGARLYDSSSR